MRLKYCVAVLRRQPPGVCRRRRPLVAHHAFGGEFDPNRPVLLKGKIVKVEWVNPHAWIHVEVVKPDGTKEVWMVEGGSPNSLLRRGVTRDSLPIGTEIVVDGYQSRDYTLPRANGRNITFVDGTQAVPRIVGNGGASRRRRSDRQEAGRAAMKAIATSLLAVLCLAANVSGQTAPEPNDYSDGKSWLCRPGSSARDERVSTSINATTVVIGGGERSRVRRGRPIPTRRSIASTCIRPSRPTRRRTAT